MWSPILSSTHPGTAVGGAHACWWKHWLTPCLFYVNSHIWTRQQQSSFPSYHLELLSQWKRHLFFMSYRNCGWIRLTILKINAIETSHFVKEIYCTAGLQCLHFAHWPQRAHGGQTWQLINQSESIIKLAIWQWRKCKQESREISLECPELSRKLEIHKRCCKIACLNVYCSKYITISLRWQSNFEKFPREHPMGPDLWECRSHPKPSPASPCFPGTL